MAPATVELHERYWKYVTEHVKPKRLGDVRPDDIESFKRWRRREGNAEQSVNNYLRDLQAIYNRAITWGYFTGENPVKQVARYKVSRPLITFFTEEELLRLLEVVAKEEPTRDERNLQWTVLLAGWAGMGKKEIVYARWEWFTFSDKPTIQIREFDGFKIKTREERIIPMSRRIYDALHPHKETEGFLFHSGRTAA